MELKRKLAVLMDSAITYGEGRASRRRTRLTLTDCSSWRSVYRKYAPMPLDCRVEHGGGHDHVVLVDGVVVWRGESPEATLTSAIQRAAAQRLLGAQSDDQ